MTGVDMALVGETFNSSLIADDDIDLTCYLSAYDELYKLCSLLGTIFGFVGSEILSKMDILRELRDEDRDGNFRTMKSMISYERDNNLMYESSYVSGSRTLLRLHRGLDFFSKFLSAVDRMGMDDDSSKAGREAYDESLAKHHSWFIRNAASLAMYSLPKKRELLNRVCAHNINECMKALPGMLESLGKVYDRVQNYYSECNLLDLP